MIYKDLLMSKSFLFVLYILSVMPLANSWTIVDKNGDIAIIHGPVRHDYDIGSLCSDIKYPGTDKYIPIWLSEQLNRIAQENYRGSAESPDSYSFNDMERKKNLFK